MDAQNTRPDRCSDERFRELVENLPMVTYIDSVGEQARTLYVSPQIEQMLGYPAQAWLDDPDFFLKVLHPDDLEWMREQRHDRQDLRDTSFVFRVVSCEGRVYTVQSERVVVRDEQGRPLHTQGFWIDITERVRLEEELRQAQKLEAIGKLAGGIAHDFNNLLLAQRGYGELALRRLERGEDGVEEDVVEMLIAVERAAALTRQLLAFARRQVLDPELLDLGLVATELERLLRRLIGEDVELVTECPEQPVLVLADRGQLEQVLTNLAVNARDAMPDGGRLTIAVGTDGENAFLTVSDTGIGMDAATAARIFEPFFTTKEEHGTGLGLATVHGIVTQSGGRISVESAPGRGSTFTISLPAGAPGEAAPSAPAGRPPVGGGETILLVEDDVSVRVALAAMLEARGYHVLSAENGDDAVAIAERHEGPIGLLVTDLVMPGRSGRETADRVRGVLPGARVLYMSGYADDAVPRDPGSSFIQKPFGGDELVRRVRLLLEREPS